MVLDEKFEMLLAEKRHKELVSSLKDITTSLNYKNFSQAVDKQSEAISGIIEAIKQLPKPEVNVDQQQVVNSLEQVCQELLRGLSELKKAIDTKTEWEFTVKRERNGYIEKIIAKQT